MDRITDLLKEQYEFCNSFINPEKASIKEKQAHTKELILHLISEADEILREINWKIHRKDAIENVDRSKIVEEIIDAFKYVLSIAHIWEIDEEELLSEFYRKSEVVKQRYKQEKQLGLLEDKNIVAIDIDGVLGKYPEAFINFISEETGIDLSNYIQKSYNLYDELADLIPGGKKKMKELKHNFRLIGKESYLPLIDGAVEALRMLNRRGKTIVLLSARPYKQYPRIFADTIDWLRTNGFVYDAIIWDENKEDRIVKEFPNMNFMVEDYEKNANKVAEKGYKVYLIDKTYNRHKLHDNVIRVKNWEEILEYER